MGKADAVIAVSRIAAAFREEKLSDDTVNVYVKHLSDIHPQLLDSAVSRVLVNAKFFPTISEIRRAALDLSGMAAPTPAEAMAIIRRADVTTPLVRRDGSPTGSVEKTWEWPEDLTPTARAAVLETLSRVGEPSDEFGKPYFGWEMGFKDTYEAVAPKIEQPLLSDMSNLKLPAPKEQKVLPMPKDGEAKPGDQKIPQCVKCGQHIGVFYTPEGVICFWCRARSEREG